MSCRPLTALQPLLGARNRFVFGYSNLSTSLLFGKPQHFACLRRTHLSYNSIRLLDVSGAGEALGVIVDRTEEDKDGPLAGESHRVDDRNVSNDGTKPIIPYFKGRPRLPVQPANVVKAARRSEAALEQASTWMDVNVSTMYTNSDTQRRTPHARQFWTLFRRMLWSEDATRLGESLLAKHRTRAAEFEQLIQREASSPIKQAPSEPLSHFYLLSVVIGGLATSARLTLSILDLVERVVVLPFQVTADCLRHLRRFRRQELESNPELLAKYHSRLSALRRPSEWPVPMRSSHMDLLLHTQTRAGALQTLRNLLKHSGTQGSSGRRFLLDTCIRAQDIESATETLTSFPQEELERPDVELMHRIINLLHLEAVQRSSGSGFFTVLPRLLELGIKPDEIIHNMAIQNAVKLDLTSLAWDLVTHAQEERLIVDSRSHLYLLKDSFRREDLHRLNEIMSRIHESKELWQNPYIVIYMMIIVREICYFKKEHSPQETLAHLLTIYDRAYNRGALIKLEILSSTQALSTTDTFPDPPPMVLAYVVFTYVLSQRRDRSVLRVWQRWTALIEQGDPLFLAAATFDAPYNAFLLFLLRSRHSLWNALPVLSFMLDKGLSKPKDETWSICIIAYLRYREPYHPMAAAMEDILIQNNAQVSARNWSTYVQPRFPGQDLESEEARRFVKRQQPYDPDEPWPNFDWDGAGMAEKHSRRM